LKILRERMKDEWYYEMDEPIVPTCSKDDAEKLPDPYREDALEKWKNYERDFRLYRKDKQWWEVAKDEIENPKGRAAKLLGWRTQCEYEDFEVVEIE